VAGCACGNTAGQIGQDRTLESLGERLVEQLAQIRVVGDTPLGFSLTKDDELNQLYVSAEARGKGVAQALIGEFEDRLAAAGVSTVWLGCAIGNDRAARFYEKCGWHLARTYIVELQLADGIFPLEVWRYEKVLRSAE
jgi:GNAT superfamily N-acetyltransferase